MNKKTGDRSGAGSRGLHLMGFIILWLIICAAAASSVIYAPEIKTFLSRTAEVLKSMGSAEDKQVNSISDEPETQADIFFNGDIETDKITGENGEKADGSSGKNDTETGNASGNDDKNGNGKEDVQSCGPSGSESLENLYEELKKPIRSFCDFLKTDAVEYFYNAVPPDCVEFLKEKYADAILFMGGESSALRLALAKELTDFKNSIGKPESVNCGISEMSEVNEKEISEIEAALRSIGSKQEVKRAFRLKLTFSMTGEKGSIDTEKTIRLIKIGTEWFLNPCDLISPEFIK